MEWGDSYSRSSSSRPIVIDASSERRRQVLTHAEPNLDDEEYYFGCFPGIMEHNNKKLIIKNRGMTAQRSSVIVELANRVKMWPPWPLSLLEQRKRDKEDDTEEVVAASDTTDAYPSIAALFWAYFKMQTRIGARQLSEVGSSLWFHLPPAAPPLILLASLPRKVLTENNNAQDGVNIYKRVVPLLSDPFVRTLALTGLGFSLMSWAHSEVHRKRHLTRLPLKVPFESVSRVFLPPVLPEEVPEPEIEALQSAQKLSIQKNKRKQHNNGENDDDDDDDDNHVLSLVSPKLRKQLHDLYDSAPSPRRLQTLLDEMKRVRAARKRETAKLHRLSVFDELVALQAIKRKSTSSRRKRNWKSDSPENNNNDDDDGGPGYALVTGASQGIGRAIAVELARWEIPLILVARDLDRLTSLAYDLEACYGIKCCVLKADLTQIDAAEKIHQATKKAGLPVDILVNNAGIAYEGLSVDMETTDVERMMMINTMSYAKLAQLYGRDMTTRRRGRILMVSSMAGLSSSSPNVGLYGATKAFGKSLALSMAKELEPFGVGVTCLVPGPVSNTGFRSRSGTSQTLCWYLPFYPSSAQHVAHVGVMSLLDGDTQVIPGWQNRVFVKLFRPIIPQRVETMTIEAAFSPLRLPRIFGRQEDKDDKRHSHQQPKKSSLKEAPASSTGIHLDLRPRYFMQTPPRLLVLPEPPEPAKMKPERSEPEKKDPSNEGVKPRVETEEQGRLLELREPQAPEKLKPESSELDEEYSSNEGVEPRTEAKEQDIISSTEQDYVTEVEKPNAIADTTHIDGEVAERSKPVENNSTDVSAMARVGGALVKVEDQMEQNSEVDVQESEREHANEHTDQACLGMKRGDEDTPELPWLWDDSNGLSPRMGPIDILEHREFMLQKLEVANGVVEFIHV